MCGIATATATGTATGQVILDRCCGVGTKTLQMRQLAGPTARIVAVDNSPVRCATLRASLAAGGISNVQVYEAAHLPPGSQDMPALFDLALVDAPCSNSGVLARRPEARYTQGKDALISLQRLQEDILVDTAARLRPGGLLVYSTCSIWPEENRGMVDAFLAARPTYRLEADLLTLPSCTDVPGHYHDGGYYALLRQNPV
jgi:16S rRNA (cytosine967-C5)-methyltransferase